MKLKVTPFHQSLKPWRLNRMYPEWNMSRIGFFNRVWRYFHRQVVFHVAWHNNLWGCAAWVKMDMFQLPHVTALCQRIIIITMFSAHSWDVVQCPINKENGFHRQYSCGGAVYFSIQQYILGFKLQSWRSELRTWLWPSKPLRCRARPKADFSLLQNVFYRFRV